MKFRDIPQFPQAHYVVNVGWDYLEKWLEGHNNRLYSINMDPDYQRPHVWTKKQKINYIEFIIRGGESGRLVFWNHPNWGRSYKGTFELVDGKQRVNAVLEFVQNKIPAFNTLCKDYEDKIRMLVPDFHMRVARLKTRKEILEWYLAINAGGTPHKKKELDKVRQLLEIEMKLLDNS